MNNRLKQFLAAENITQAQLADNLQVVRASVSHILSGRNNPGYDFIKALMSRYPKLNIEWLIFGKGKMYKDQQIESTLPFEEAETIVNNEDILLFQPADSHVESPAAKKEEIKMNTLNHMIQTPVIQRKVKKIIVFFDDDTYQEL